MLTDNTDGENANQGVNERIGLTVHSFLLSFSSHVSQTCRYTFTYDSTTCDLKDVLPR